MEAVTYSTRGFVDAVVPENNTEHASQNADRRGARNNVDGVGSESLAW
jgi:hypothetical protein